MLLQTSANRDESRYMVGGNGILSGLGGVMGWMARWDDESWLFVGCVGIVVGMLVSNMSSEAEVETELVISISISVVLVHWPLQYMT